MKKTIENHQAPLARNEELAVQEMPDEVLIYDLKQHKAHCLNRTAAFIWNHCNGQTTVNEIARLMEEEWRTPVSEDAVWYALNKLSKADLLQERIKVPEAKTGMSRRSAMRRLGIGSLLAIPVVMSIVSPAAAAAASVPPACQACVKKLNENPCPADCGPTVVCTCYGDNGCGNDPKIGPRSCAACKALNVSPLSWQCN